MTSPSDVGKALIHGTGTARYQPRWRRAGDEDSACSSSHGNHTVAGYANRQPHVAEREVNGLHERADDADHRTDRGKPEHDEKSVGASHRAGLGRASVPQLVNTARTSTIAPLRMTVTGSVRPIASAEHQALWSGPAAYRPSALRMMSTLVRTSPREAGHDLG